MTLVIINNTKSVNVSATMESIESVLTSLDGVLDHLEIILRSPQDDQECDSLVAQLDSINTKVPYEYRLVLDPLLVTKVHTNTGNDNTSIYSSNPKVKVVNNHLLGLASEIGDPTVLFLHEGDKLSVDNMYCTTSLVNLLKSEGISKLAINNKYNVFNKAPVSKEVYTNDYVDLNGLLISSDLIHSVYSYIRSYPTNVTDTVLRLALESVGFLAQGKGSFTWLSVERRNIEYPKKSDIYRFIEYSNYEIKPKVKLYNISTLLNRVLTNAE